MWVGPQFETGFSSHRKKLGNKEKTQVNKYANFLRKSGGNNL